MFHSFERNDDDDDEINAILFVTDDDLAQMTFHFFSVDSKSSNK